MANKNETAAPLPKGGVDDRDILEVALDLSSNRGEETAAYRIDELSPLVTFAILTSAASVKRAESIAEHAEESLEAHGYKVGHIEGRHGSAWILVDAGSVVVHVFTREERERIKLDEIYVNCPQTRIGEGDLKAYLAGVRGE